MNVTRERTAERGGWLRREAKRATWSREWGTFSHVRDAGSAQRIKAGGSDRTSECSDTSNLARSTIRRVILVNESLSATGDSTLNLFTVQIFSSVIRHAVPSRARFLRARSRHRIFILATPSLVEMNPKSEVKRMKDGRITLTFREVMTRWSYKGERHVARRRVG